MKKISWWRFYFIGMFFVLLMLSFFQSQTNHYVGEQIITLEQYNQIENVLTNKETNYITPTEEGNLLAYDFYSTTNLEYLNTKPYTVFDSAIFQVLRELIRNNLFVVLGVLWVVLYYISRFRVGLLSRLRLKIIHYFQRQADKKIPLMAKHSVVNSPGEIKTDGQKGIYVVRSWDVDEKGQLKSLVNDLTWDDKSITADKNPHTNNSKGLYGYRLGTSIKQTGKIMGVAVLNGEYYYHPDGIVRAEHCEILGFFVSKGFERTARFISNKYGLPVYMANETEQAYYDWLFSAEGNKAMQSNYELLGV
ncbi:MAG: hypothetical protein PHQ86_09620 [Dehalococcoidales bacterium]|nr:hypothetical protein [Dehalococcoidales bacterium]